jgi:transposase
LAYHEITRMDIWEVIRRWHDRQSISQIAFALEYDRKTVRTHIRTAVSLGLSLERALPAKDDLLAQLKTSGTPLGRSARAQQALTPHLDEIARLINDPEIALKPKTAFEVISSRYGLTGMVSYASFKRFARQNELALYPKRATCRLEASAGSEVQVDYAQVCLLPDPDTGKRHRLYVFIGTLAHSRVKYVELTFGQDQRSFVASHIRMFEYFGGVPAREVLDNLKSGVLKPDIYDPQFNRTFREMAEHYSIFLDPARVRRPRDKGKVERDVQTVRQAARKILLLNPGAPLAELNRELRHWASHEYGERLHGTTHEMPSVVFRAREKPALKALPAKPFEIAEWKLGTVHPDHYIQFHGKAYSVPHAYVGRKVWIRATARLLQVFYDDQLVKQHVITGRLRTTDFTDFPVNVQAALDTSRLHKSLLERAERIGPTFLQLIRELLEEHAFLNLRRAQGLVAAAEEERSPVAVECAVRALIGHGVKVTPVMLRHVLTRLAAEETASATVPLSPETQAFVRDPSYFIHTGEEAV